tara:strand:- start:19454 stop:19861 length:408 start_codon:yes stop_codon:yes gene_type:complete
MVKERDKVFIQFHQPELSEDIHDDDLDVIMGGEKLANWLAGLAPTLPGLEVTDSPIMEDWGWVVPVCYNDEALFLGSYGDWDRDGLMRMIISYDAVFPWTSAKRRAAMKALSDVLMPLLEQQTGVSRLKTGFDDW